MASSPGLLDHESFPAAVHAALASWGQTGGTDESFLGSLLLVRQMRAELGDQAGMGSLRQATNRVLEGGIEELAVHDQTGAAVLRAHFIDGEITRAVAARLHASPDQVNRWQRAAVQQLADILLTREMSLRNARLARLETVLPPPTYVRLFGFDQAQDILFAKLIEQGPPWMVAITGIGGIGKTSLADAVTRLAIQTLAFDHVVWLRAEGQPLSGAPLPPTQQIEALLVGLDVQISRNGAAAGAPGDLKSRVRQALKAQPHLVVVDNLEVAADIDHIVAELQELVEPTKVLLTTRYRPAVVAPVYFYSLEELSLEDAADLLRHFASMIGVAELAQAPEEDVAAIYALTGGNPMALKLIVSLAAVLPLAHVLASVGHNAGGPAQELFRHIYWQAWRTLSPEAQTLLQAMPLTAEPGALPEQMQAMSGLDEAAFWPALTELASRSLLEVRGSVHERRYGIHRLTASFLLSEIIHWPSEESG